jgi:N-acetyl-anhydromuramyl-L-alanine amidase AmpD
MKVSYEFMRSEGEVDLASEYHVSAYEDSPVVGKCNKFNARKNDGVPIYIVQHHTVADYDGTISLFNANKEDQNWNWGSAHYVIKEDGSVDCMVNPEYRAYHAGGGYLVPGSKLNSTGKVTINDLNSWSIGIENVNDGYSMFPKEQMYSNLLLMENLVQKFPSIDTKKLLGHGDWDPSRKCDPNPYFDWELAAVASKKFQEIDHNFGVYPSIQYKADSNELISGFKPDTAGFEDIKSVQNILSEIGYNVFATNRENEGIYDCQTKNCVKAFKNHYLNTAVISHLENIRDYEPYENHNPFMIEVTENTLDIMGEVADLLG